MHIFTTWPHGNGRLRQKTVNIQAHCPLCIFSTGRCLIWPSLPHPPLCASTRKVYQQPDLDVQYCFPPASLEGTALTSVNSDLLLRFNAGQRSMQSATVIRRPRRLCWPLSLVFKATRCILCPSSSCALWRWRRRQCPSTNRSSLC